MVSPIHGFRKRRQDHRWCGSQDPLAIYLGGEPFQYLKRLTALLTVARRQEPSHRIVLRKSTDIGQANAEHQAVECGPGEFDLIVLRTGADSQMCGMF